MTKSKSETMATTPAFEEAMGELESIVRRLENGGESLENALEDYSNAIGLLKLCHQKLEQAERRVEVLSGVDAEGNPVSEPIEEVQESLEEKRQTRSSKRTAGKKPASQSTSERSSAHQPSSTSKNRSVDGGLF